MGRTSGSGCTGSFEQVQVNNGLCVAKMVAIDGPTAILSYQIDATEVTQGQYGMWLATNPALPAKTDANCGYVAGYGGYTDTGAGYTVADAGYSGADADHHPAATVDWCDAYAYCKGAGKRLCGAIGGGSNPVDSSNDANASQWYRACSSGGINTFPYGNTYQQTYCNTAYNGPGTTTAVGSMANCVTLAAGYVGIYDLSGNVNEWEDSCTGSGPSAYCELRGGSMGGSDFLSGCSSALADIMRNSVNTFIGFRCCSP